MNNNPSLFYDDAKDAALSLDTEHLECLAKELLNVAQERRHIEAQKQAKTHIDAIVNNIAALKKLGYQIHIIGEYTDMLINVTDLTPYIEARKVSDE